MASKKPLIGVLGGMGPLATADFLRALTLNTKAARDQDHFRVLLYSNPLVPDRSSAILGNGESPLPDLLDGLARLEQNAVDVIAIPCNASHFWIDELRAACSTPILSIVEAVRGELERLAIEGPVGILATQGTMISGIFQQRLAEAGFSVVVPTADEQRDLVSASILAVKSSRLDEGRRLALQAIDLLERRGAAAVVLGCTEFPVVVPEMASRRGSALVNSTDAQAKACIRWAEAWAGTAAPLDALAFGHSN